MMPFEKTIAATKEAWTSKKFQEVKKNVWLYQSNPNETVIALVGKTQVKFMFYKNNQFYMGSFEELS